MAEHAFLVTQAELPNYGISSDFLDPLPTDMVNAVLQSVTDEVLSRIDPAYIAPLTSWGADLKGYTARIVRYELQSIVGMSPSQAAMGDENLRKSAEDARLLLDRIGKGEIPLQGIADSSATPGDHLIRRIASDTPRGW